MEETESLDFTGSIFDNATENKNSSQENEDGIPSLNGKSNCAISGEDIEKNLIARVQHVIQISQSSVGLLFASVQILNDWHKLSEFGLHPGDWLMHLSRLIQNLKQDSDFETDRLQSKTIKNPVLKLLLLTPSPEYRSAQKDCIFAIRGLVVIQALVVNKKPSTQLIAGLSKLFSKKPGFENISDLNLTAIREFKSVSNQHDHEVFLSTLQKLVTKPWVDLESIVSPRNSHLIQASASAVDATKPQEQKSPAGQINNKKDDEQESRSDLINYITYIQQFLGEKQNVGILERYEYVQRFEIEIIIPEIIQDLKDLNVSKVALATLLTFFLHCRPERRV